ncbi:hypothetical protein D9M70_489780 [compost metagenome]
MQDVAAEDRFVALGTNAENHLARAVARCRLYLQAAGDLLSGHHHLGEAFADHRHHAVEEGLTEHVHHARLLVAALVAKNEVILGDVVARIGEGRYPAVFLPDGIPADVVRVQVRHHHMGDLLRRSAGRDHPFAHKGVEHVHARDAGARLEVAHAGIDHDDAVTGVYDPELDGHNQLVHVRDPVMRRHQVRVRVEHGTVDVGEEKGRIVRWPHVLEDAGDLQVADGARLHHVRCLLGSYGRLWQASSIGDIHHRANFAFQKRAFRHLHAREQIPDNGT